MAEDADNHADPGLNTLDPHEYECLDDIFMASMALLQDCLQIRSKLTKCLQLAFFLLAKARYIIGKNRIGSAQLPGPEDTITANCTVQSNLPPDSDCYFFNLVTKSNSEMKENKDVLGPVHRGVQPDRAGDEQDDGEIMEANKSNSDPLRWFGILVPQELRTAQAAFKKATELSVEVVNLQMKVEHTSHIFWSIMQNATSFSCDDEP